MSFCHVVYVKCMWAWYNTLGKKTKFVGEINLLQLADHIDPNFSVCGSPFPLCHN